jgi:hypothetical protein
MSPKGKYTPPVKKRKSKHPAALPVRPSASMPSVAAPAEEHKIPVAGIASEVAVKHADLPYEMRRVGIVSGIVLAIMAVLWLLVR